jgi:hypothetical protein
MCPFCATTVLTAASAASAATAISTLGFDLIRQIVAGAKSLTELFRSHESNPTRGGVPNDR